MSLAVVSLIALLAVIVFSCFAPVNIGFLSIALAFLIGRAGGLPVAAIVGGFPASLFVTLTGITLLFSQARVNGTLEQVATRSVALARGNRGMIPIIFFFLGRGLASIGAGNIAAGALLAPVAMSVAGRAGISGFLMAIMFGNGANAGALSPLAPTGIIARDLMGRAGLQGVEWANYFNTLAAQSLVAFGGYFLLGGLKLFRARTEPAAKRTRARERAPPITGHQWLTLGVITALILSVVLLASTWAGGLRGRRDPDPAARGRRGGGHAVHAVGRDPDGLRRDHPRGGAGQDGRNGAVHRAPGPALGAGLRDRRDRPGDRA